MHHSPLAATLLSTLLLATAACGGDAPADDDGPFAFEVRAVDYAFIAPDEIPAGWVTYTLDNQTASEIHEISITRLPEGRTLAEYREQVLPVWEDVRRALDSGEVDGAAAAYRLAGEGLPDWASAIEYLYARGLVSPGRSTETTLYLEPGEYLVECWVKSVDGPIHNSRGMMRMITATGEPAGREPRQADIELDLRDGELRDAAALPAGTHSVAVAFDPEGGLGNLHLIRLDSDTDPDTVLRWLDWYSPGGLQAPAPAEFYGGSEFYGGPAPDALRFTVRDLEPGRYAWVAHGAEPVWQEIEVR